MRVIFAVLIFLNSVSSFASESCDDLSSGLTGIYTIPSFAYEDTQISFKKVKPEEAPEGLTKIAKNNFFEVKGKLVGSENIDSLIVMPMHLTDECYFTFFDRDERPLTNLWHYGVLAEKGSNGSIQIQKFYSESIIKLVPTTAKP